MFTLSGMTGVYATSKLDRCYRDISTLTQHAVGGLNDVDLCAGSDLEDPIVVLGTCLHRVKMAPHAPCGEGPSGTSGRASGRETGLNAPDGYAAPCAACSCTVPETPFSSTAPISVKRTPSVLRAASKTAPLTSTSPGRA